MASYFIDLDGVFFKYGTMTPTSGAVRTVKALVRAGHRIYFTTKRKYHHNEPPQLNLSYTKKVLRRYGIAFAGIISDSSNPRIMINDEGAVAIQHPQDQSFPKLNQLEAFDTRNQTMQVCHALTAMAWTAWKYQCSGDADDYVQTMLVARSLVHNHGFNHADIVKRYRATPTYILNSQTMVPGGLLKTYYGQVAKLIASADPLYVSCDGISDGAAMKVLPIAAFYHQNFTTLVQITDRITRITHNAPDARLAAILIVLRFRQILLGDATEDIEGLIHNLQNASRIVALDKQAGFFLKQVRSAAALTRKTAQPSMLLTKLARHIGLEHLAWSTPISACFWSYRAHNDFPKWFTHDGEHSIHVGDTIIDAHTLKKSVVESYRKHLQQTGRLAEFVRSHGHHWRTSIDVDTFFSIAFSLIAAKEGINPIVDDLQQVKTVFPDDLSWISRQLITQGYAPNYAWIDSPTVTRLRERLAMLGFLVTLFLTRTYDSVHLNLGFKRGIRRLKFMLSGKY